MSYEISRPNQFLSQPPYMNEVNHGTNDFTYFRQLQNRSSAYDIGATDKPSLGTENIYIGLAPSSPQSTSSSFSSNYHDPPSTLTVSTSLASSQITSNQFSTYPTDPDLSISPLSSSPLQYGQHQQNGLSAPLPTSTSMYEFQFARDSVSDDKVSTAPIIDNDHSQQNTTWKQDFYSPPLTTINTSWTQSQQEGGDFVQAATLATTLTRSSSYSPSLRYRNSMTSSNIPPCNCIPIIHYNQMPTRPETFSTHYQEPSASSASPSLLPTGIYSKLVNSDSKTMGYFHQSQQRLSVDQPYQWPPLDLSPSSSSSLSDDYSQHHHQQRPSLNNYIDKYHATSPTTSSSSSSNTGTITASTATSTPRRYKCTVCVKRFTRPSSLATHMHSHTGEKPYKCLVNGCGRRFSVVSNLRRHAKIHLHATSVVGSGRKPHLI